MSDKQRDALKLGEKIRQILCMDSIAWRYFGHDTRVYVRSICDLEMKRLGYETITEHKERIAELFRRTDYESISDREVKRLLRFQKKD